MNPETINEARRETEKKCIEWIGNQLIENAGVEFTEEEIKEKLDEYLQANNKNVLELTEEDRQNIYADVLMAYLDGEMDDAE